MFSRLLVKSTIICSVGVCAVRFANSQRGGSQTQEQTGVRFTTLAFAANRRERPTSKDPYKSFSPTEFNSIDSQASEIRMDYKEEADIIAKKAYNIYKSTDWKVAKASNDNGNTDYFEKEVKVLYKKSTEFDGHIYRAECVIDSPAEKVIRYILPSPRGLRGKWDKTVKESEVIEKIDEDLIVGRSATHSVAMGLISSRDFVDLIAVRRYPEESIICTNSKSIQRKDCPPKDGYVRGVNYHGGTFCTPVEGEPDKCYVVNIVQTDLSGMLPKSVVESALPTNLIDFFRDLDEALKDNSLNCT
ncbi:StAR-related lipid transfer protein 5 [Holothuria leucospilota]|uniref:StAR-related lipid transfer protein 5 n=1 Tax=Holothuria leucospilota TaxID=206669 RepID=A0A9Q1BNN3_HOLLE|nr:StAR-related lipid transfer protein 5 [Holothuria leucospilota]